MILIDTQPSVVKMLLTKKTGKKCPTIFGHCPPGTIALRNLNQARTIIKVYVIASASNVLLGVVSLSSTLCYYRKNGEMVRMFIFSSAIDGRIYNNHALALNLRYNLMDL